MDPGVPIRAVGDRAVLVELPGLPEVLSLQAQLDAEPSEGQIDVVAAAQTVLVTAGSPRQAAGIARRIRSLDFSVQPPVEEARIDIEVVYDGADLAEVARHAGLSESGVVEAHTSQDWTAAFGGFAPGFAYLTGGDRRLEVPRRTSPRTSVPAGSVALAGGYSAVYPRESPGGWQLIGRTAAVLWDLGRDVPALIRPGDRVRFTAVRESISTSAPPRAASAPGSGALPARRDRRASRKISTPTPGPGAFVVETGLSSLLEDLGRPGYAALGVAGSGALDRGSCRQANRLVGNPPGAAVIESLLGGLVLEARLELVLAVTGAPAPLTVNSPGGTRRSVDTCSPFLLRAGERLAVGAPTDGLRTYTAVRGGWEAAPVLGSRSTDVLSGLGPLPLARGGFLRAGTAPGSAVGHPELPSSVSRPAVLRIVPGPRADWFADGEPARLCAVWWTVTPQSNRVGLRLEGPALRRVKSGELPSEGAVRGALQVPPSGLPVLFLADHPVTGGYPVIGVVISEDLDRAAQLPPGAEVRFEASSGRSPLPGG
ncbi:5-oxoprolinase/urea amidolyase family protein [Arthrobacter crusticola]|uniref:5-oxoprolinase/urea amidolyase family protein n=1 Tax=Arthrobacter crusticola TaxID=2547960 RepID=A0A4R5TU43_9MICC|nr:carboxyltransferase domain-containing protein [Arthrobacter crusticola]TDK24557.1 5-oxoprolinase/urea amidolyase family protein [Arthrobacter crusticola]